jgi:hypothetical protein
MEDLSASILIGLATGLASGLVTGIYSGRIISRRNRFDSLRADLLRHVNSIEYMQEDGHVDVKRGTSSQILDVASDFAHFGHRQAAEATLTGNRLAASALSDSERGALDVAALEKRLKEPLNNSPFRATIARPDGDDDGCS